MNGCRLDHLVVIAPDLESGSRWVEARLGIAPGRGGRHPDMGTHNRLLRLGARRYLEVIAVDAQAPAPATPRWFGLDRPPAAPVLGAWVARCDELASALAAHPEAPGTPRRMRRGDFTWAIAFADDGTLCAGGALPYLIQWPPGVHPCTRLPDEGLHLLRLTIRHPRPERIRAALESLGLEGEPLALEAGPPGLAAVIGTPSGRATLP